MNVDEIITWITLGLYLLLFVLAVIQIISHYCVFRDGILGEAVCTFMCGRSSPYRFKMFFYVGLLTYIPFRVADLLLLLIDLKASINGSAMMFRYNSFVHPSLEGEACLAFSTLACIGEIAEIVAVSAAIYYWQVVISNVVRIHRRIGVLVWSRKVLLVVVSLLLFAGMVALVCTIWFEINYINHKLALPWIYQIVSSAGFLLTSIVFLTHTLFVHKHTWVDYPIDNQLTKKRVRRTCKSMIVLFSCYLVRFVSVVLSDDARRNYLTEEHDKSTPLCFSLSPCSRILEEWLGSLLPLYWIVYQSSKSDDVSLALQYGRNRRLNNEYMLFSDSDGLTSSGEERKANAFAMINRQDSDLQWIMRQKERNPQPSQLPQRMHMHMHRGGGGGSDRRSASRLYHWLESKMESSGEEKRGWRSRWRAWYRYGRSADRNKRDRLAVLRASLSAGNNVPGSDNGWSTFTGTGGEPPAQFSSWQGSNYSRTNRSVSDIDRELVSMTLSDESQQHAISEERFGGL